MKLLITGGCGYLGGRLAQFLASQTGHEILLGSRQYAAPPSWLPQAKVAQTPWDSSSGLEQSCAGVEAVVHLAGMNAQDCAADPVAALEVNAVATARLLQAAIRQGVKRFIYLSTAHVYGSPLKGVITEESCAAPLHPYATSHRAGEDVVRAASQRREVEGIVIRLSNAYGAPAHKEVHCWMLLVNNLCRQAVTTEGMVLHSSGRQRRDFIPLADACRAMQHLLELPAAGVSEGLFNVGSGWTPTVLEMAQRIAQRVQAVTGRPPEILRHEERESSAADSLDYRTDRLAETGFHGKGTDNVDRELDELIHFCLEQAHKS
ncbi:MAG: SDR family oxidoreductase [Acidobacteriota bacterium]|nr:SDR family oxidoreductase [Acidobacteriota bacterium]